MSRSLAVACWLAVLVSPATALAFSSQGSLAWRNWNSEDRCAQTAFKQFPDYTPEGNLKRDNAYQQCLAAQNLPPRQLPSLGGRP